MLGRCGICPSLLTGQESGPRFISLEFAMPTEKSSKMHLLPSKSSTTEPVQRVSLTPAEFGPFLREKPFVLLKIEDRKTGKVYFEKK